MIEQAKVSLLPSKDVSIERFRVVGEKVNELSSRNPGVCREHRAMQNILRELLFTMCLCHENPLVPGILETIERNLSSVKGART